MNASFSRGSASGRGVTRTIKEVSALDLKSWLSRRGDPQKFYWADRDGRSEVATTGCCAIARTERELLDLYRLIVGDSESNGREEDPDLDPRLYGGLSFDAFLVAESGGDWPEFGQIYWFLPELEMRRVDDRYFRIEHFWGARSAFTDPGTTCINTSTQAQGPSTTGGICALSIQELGHQHLLSPSDWADNVNKVLKRIRDGEVEKVVLSRPSMPVARPLWDGLSCLRFWSELNPGCYPFYFQPLPEVSFFGCSPELLFERTERHLKTEALASTEGRGESPEEDERLGQAMLHNAKGLRENLAVETMLERALSPFVWQQSRQDYDVVKLNGLQHLRKKLSAELKCGATDWELLKALHPTPAVCGYPRKEAFELIKGLEGFGRGWYCGVIGYMGARRSQMVVALRCAKRSADQQMFYCGAGIVEGSEPSDEWQELDRKLASLGLGKSARVEQVSGF